MKRVAIGCVLLVFFIAIGISVLAAPAGAADIGEQTRHFDVYYANTPPDGSAIGSAIESAYSEINGYFGNIPPKVKVLVVGKKTMDKVGEHVEAFSAWNKKSSTIVLREETIKNKKSLDIVIRHELCHLGLNDILARKQSKDYAWMEEGVSMVFSKEPFSDVKVSKYIIGKGFLSPQEIADAVSSKSYDISKNGYMQSYSLVKYMARRFGASTVINILKCPETSFEKAFMMYTGIDFGTFYRQWEAYVKNAASGGQAESRPTFSYLNYGLEFDDLLE
jgi:hypothetical protein